MIGCLHQSSSTSLVLDLDGKQRSPLGQQQVHQTMLAAAFATSTEPFYHEPQEKGVQAGG